jgi:very-short-patch-repair endonuclease
MFNGIYLYGHTAAPELAWETAALLATAPAGVLSHHTVLHLDGLLPRPDTIHVSVPTRRRRQARLVPHTGAVGAPERRTVRGLAATTTERALRDVASLLDPDTLERLTNEAEARGLIEARPGPGITRREAERRLKHLLRRAGLRPTGTNVHVESHEVDVLFAPQRLIVEVDGYAFHRTRRAFEKDRRRDADLVAAGYRTIRVTWTQLTAEPERVAARLGAALAR